MDDNTVNQMVAEIYTEIILDVCTPEQIIALSRDTALLHSYIKALDKKLSEYWIEGIKNAIGSKHPLDNWGEIFSQLKPESEPPLYREPNRDIFTPYNVKELIIP